MKIWNQQDMRDTVSELMEQTSTYDLVSAIIDALKAIPESDGNDILDAQVTGGSK